MRSRFSPLKIKSFYCGHYFCTMHISWDISLSQDKKTYPVYRCLVLTFTWNWIHLSAFFGSVPHLQFKIKSGHKYSKIGDAFYWWHSKNDQLTIHKSSSYVYIYIIVKSTCDQRFSKIYSKYLIGKMVDHDFFHLSSIFLFLILARLKYII